MSIDPASEEGRRRKRRGLFVYAFTLVALVVQGMPLVWAIRTQEAAVWVRWVLVLIAAVIAFWVEHRTEMRRRSV